MMHVFNFSMFCLRSFCSRGRVTELQAKDVTSRHIKPSEATQSSKKDGTLFAFP